MEIVFEIVARPGVLKDGENIFKKRKGEKEDCVGMCKGMYVCVVCLDLVCVCVCACWVWCLSMCVWYVWGYKCVCVAQAVGSLSIRHIPEAVFYH